MPTTTRRRSREEDSENIDPNTHHTAAASSSASSSSTAAAAEPHAKKRRKSAESAAGHRARTLTKEELADLIERGKFWQECEAAKGEGDGYKDGRSEVATDEPIYEDCNEIRRKINAFLKTGRMTQTAWLKLIGSNSSSYQNFMKQKGPSGGSHSSVYPGAARFFESLRILEHKPKSAKRLKEEAAFGRYGRSTADQSRIWVRKGDQLQMDEVGRIHVIPGGRTR